MNKYIRIEYDINYTGGEYSGCGDFVLLPLDSCNLVGIENTFLIYTGIPKIHIIHYCPDDLYDECGDYIYA